MQQFIFTLGNLLHFCSELIDVDDEIMRSAAFQASTFTTWYIGTLSNANSYFGITIEDTLMSVKKRLDKINPPYVVEVMYDVEDTIPRGLARAISCILSLKAAPMKNCNNAWEIAPEMHELQGYGSESDNIRLAFVKLKATQISNAWRCNDGQWVLRSTYKNTQAIWLHILTSGERQPMKLEQPNYSKASSLLLILLPTATQQMAF